MSPAKCSSNILYINVNWSTMVQKFKYITMCFELLKIKTISQCYYKKLTLYEKKISNNQKINILFGTTTIFKKSIYKKIYINNLTVYLM